MSYWTHIPVHRRRYVGRSILPRRTPSPSGSESSDGDSSDSASASASASARTQSSARAPVLETAPDRSDASMNGKSSDSETTSGKSQSGSKAEEDTDMEEEEEEDVDDETEPGPNDLDEPWEYTFQAGDAVWIRVSDDKWYIAKVGRNTRKRATRQGEGIFYPAVWRPGRANLRKYFAPLNGEIKPDTPRTRRLLREAGLL